MATRRSHILSPPRGESPLRQIVGGHNSTSGPQAFASNSVRMAARQT